MDGRVSKIGRKDTGYGRYVVIDHGLGWTTWYAHLETISCTIGAFVSRGEVIGTAGSSGNSTGTHLHLTVQNSEFGMSGYWLPNIVDPLHYL